MYKNRHILDESWLHMLAKPAGFLAFPWMALSKSYSPPAPPNLTAIRMSARNRPMRDYLLISAVFVAVAASASGAPASEAPARQDQHPAAAAKEMARPGAHEAALAAQVGTWNVVATMWPAPHAAPIVTRGLVAERAMIGAYLQEIMHPAPGANVPDFRRLDYLNFDHVEGRWKYVSMDTRFPVSIMPAKSTGIAEDARIALQFEPQAFVGFGDNVEGRFMLSDMVVTSSDKDHQVKEQRVNMANGKGESWLFVRYEYARQR